MELKDFFDRVGGNYDEVLSRLMTDKRIYKYLGMFESSDNYPILKSALSDMDCRQIFNESHTMKGMCANLGLKSLENASSDICELFRPCRNSDCDISLFKEGIGDITPLVNALDCAHEITVSSIKELLT